MPTGARIATHMAWNCCVANDVWASISLPIHKWPRYIEDFHQLWDKITISLEQTEIEKVAITIIQIWHQRNEFVFFFFKKKTNTSRTG